MTGNCEVVSYKTGVRKKPPTTEIQLYFSSYFQILLHNLIIHQMKAGRGEM